MKKINKIFSAAVAGLLAMSFFSCEAINDADDLLAASGTTNAMYIDGIYLSGLDKVADDTVVTVKVAGRNIQTYKTDNGVDKLVAAGTDGATTGENWKLNATGIDTTTLETFKLGDTASDKGYKTGYGYVKFTTPVKVESDATVSSRTVRVEVSFTSGGNACTVQPDKSTSYFTVDMATSPYKTVDANLEHRFLVLSTNTTNVSVYDSGKAMVLGSASFTAPAKAENKVNYAKESDGSFKYDIAKPVELGPLYICSNYGDVELKLPANTDENTNGSNTRTATIKKGNEDSWGRSHSHLEFGVTTDTNWSKIWRGATALTADTLSTALSTTSNDNNETSFDVAAIPAGKTKKEVTGDITITVTYNRAGKVFSNVKVKVSQAAN